MFFSWLSRNDIQNFTFFGGMIVMTRSVFPNQKLRKENSDVEVRKNEQLDDFSCPDSPELLLPPPEVHNTEADRFGVSPDRCRLLR